MLPESEQEFIYILEAIESIAPLPQGNEEIAYLFTLMGNQSMALEPLTFTTVGEYQYRLQVLESKSDREFIYDTEVYEITVFVTESGGRLRADMIAVNKAGFKNEELSFTHSYEEMVNLPPNILEPTPADPVPQANTPPSPNDLGNQTGQMASGVKTGDPTQRFLFIGVGLLALLMILVVLRNARRNSHRYLY